jgi:signal peptidase II
MVLFWITTVLSFLLSLAAKVLADQLLHGRMHILGSFAGLDYSLNPGIAFGITFPGGLQSLLVPAALLLMLWVALRSARSVGSQAGFGLIIGGAFANVVDRLHDGFVTDFFQVGTFPIFNVADSCITVGVGVLLVEMVVQWKKGVVR